MKNKLVTSCVLIVIICSFVYGYTFGNSNFGYTGYPSFDKRKPIKPYNANKYAAQTYRDEVDNYIKEANEYLEGALNDIERINDEISATKAEANRVIEEYNNWVKYGR